MVVFICNVILKMEYVIVRKDFRELNVINAILDIMGTQNVRNAFVILKELKMASVQKIYVGVQMMDHVTVRYVHSIEWCFIM